MKRFILLIIAIIFFSCKNSPDIIQDKIFPEKSYVIIPYGQENERLFEESIPVDLTEDDINDIENILVMIISEHNNKVKNNPYNVDWMNQELDLSRYLRQYVPVLNKNGEKEVFISCSAIRYFLVEGWKEWNTRLVMVADGGNDFFEITININTRTYSYFFIHGYA
jgi:hypothetical protein